MGYGIGIHQVPLIRIPVAQNHLIAGVKGVTSRVAEFAHGYFTQVVRRVCVQYFKLEQSEKQKK